MIAFENLTKRYGEFTAVDNLSVEVPREGAIALWGPNGAGKTTVIRCLIGLLRYEGRITVEKLDVRKKGKAVRSLIGYVPQELAFYQDMSAADTTRFFGQLKKVRPERDRQVLQLVGLDAHAQKRVGALSGGMKQRLALALALLADPPVLVLDEPTSNLDAAARDQFLELLCQVKAGGRTVLFTSHRLEEVVLLADHVHVLKDGKLAATYSADELAVQEGLQKQMRLALPAEALDAAMTVLNAGGFDAHRNGAGLLVKVPAHEKAAPIRALTQANIVVRDFEFE
jgi:ABC-type multidrug transport system ATPase subunit